MRWLVKHARAAAVVALAVATAGCGPGTVVPTASATNTAPVATASAPPTSPSPSPTASPSPSASATAAIKPNKNPSAPRYGTATEYCQSLTLGPAYAAAAGQPATLSANIDPVADGHVLCTWTLSAGVAYASATVDWTRSRACPVRVESVLNDDEDLSFASQSLSTCSSSEITVTVYEYRDKGPLVLSQDAFGEQFARTVSRADDAEANWG